MVIITSLEKGFIDTEQEFISNFYDNSENEYCDDKYLLETLWRE